MTQTMEDFLTEVNARLTPPDRDTWTRLASEAKDRRVRLLAAQPQPPNDLHPFQVGSVTDDWITASLTYRADSERHRAQADVLQTFIREAEETAGRLRPDPDAKLRAYDAKLEELLDETAGIAATLNGADTAEAAVRADRSAEWKRLDELAADYHRLRTAQMPLYDIDTRRLAVPSAGGEAHASDLYVANLDDLWPTWKQPERTPGTVYLGQAGRADRHEPWPIDQVQLLIWLATSDAEPWIPTSGQLEQHWQARAHRANPNPKVIPGFIDYANTTIGTVRQPQRNPIRTAPVIR